MKTKILLGEAHILSLGFRCCATIQHLPRMYHTFGQPSSDTEYDPFVVDDGDALKIVVRLVVSRARTSTKCFMAAGTQ